MNPFFEVLPAALSPAAVVVVWIAFCALVRLNADRRRRKSAMARELTTKERAELYCDPMIRPDPRGIEIQDCLKAMRKRGQA